jgi:hypothetical protein
MVCDLGFRVWGFELRISGAGLGFRVMCIAIRVEGLGFMV